jgi:hypothetical protein
MDSNGISLSYIYIIYIGDNDDTWSCLSLCDDDIIIIIIIIIIY